MGPSGLGLLIRVRIGTEKDSLLHEMRKKRRVEARASISMPYLREVNELVQGLYGGKS